MSMFEKAIKRPGCETPEFRPTAPPLPCNHIAIPVAEYIYLQRVDALMEALMQADTYNSTQVLASVKRAVLAARGSTEAGAEE